VPGYFKTTMLTSNAENLAQLPSDSRRVYVNIRPQIFTFARMQFGELASASNFAYEINSFDGFSMSVSDFGRVITETITFNTDFAGFNIVIVEALCF
jgi:hypothetical protein